MTTKPDTAQGNGEGDARIKTRATVNGWTAARKEKA